MECPAYFLLPEVFFLNVFRVVRSNRQINTHTNYTYISRLDLNFIAPSMPLSNVEQSRSNNSHRGIGAAVLEWFVACERKRVWFFPGDLCVWHTYALTRRRRLQRHTEIKIFKKQAHLDSARRHFTMQYLCGCALVLVGCRAVIGWCAPFNSDSKLEFWRHSANHIVCARIASARSVRALNRACLCIYSYICIQCARQTIDVCLVLLSMCFCRGAQASAAFAGTCCALWWLMPNRFAHRWAPKVFCRAALKWYQQSRRGTAVVLRVLARIVRTKMIYRSERLTRIASCKCSVYFMYSH